MTQIADAIGNNIKLFTNHLHNFAERVLHHWGWAALQSSVPLAGFLEYYDPFCLSQNIAICGTHSKYLNSDTVSQ